MHVLEILVIEETDPGVFFRFEHFERNCRAWETDAPGTGRLAKEAP